MAQVTISGTVKAVGKTQEVSASFRKRELVITEPSGQRPQHIPVEFTQDRVSLLDDYKPGDEVSVMAYVNGREWTGKDGVTKYFLSLSGNRIERAGGAAPSSGGGYQQAPPPTMVDMPASAGSSSDEDDLPF